MIKKIEHSTIIEDFSKHIDLNANKRILFSASFGAGKSTFLDDFFELKKESYVSIKLYPVDYAVTDNDDVFELIKFDILCELLGRYKDEIRLEKEDFSLLLKTQVFALHNVKILPVTELVVKASSKIGKTGIAFLKAIKDVYKDYKKFDEETKIDEEKSIESYLNRFSENSPRYEMDDMSQLICNILSRVKKETTKKETVLIIDDLDRLDPEHVFRLFNIFSAHINSVYESNKFDFDKIIFVCDIQNIKKMFSHRYGKGVDFNDILINFIHRKFSNLITENI